MFQHIARFYNYLGQLIVTAAVYRAGVSPYTSSYDLAETCVFGKQSLQPIHCGPLRLHAQGASPY
jgi:hypothetical protein